MLFRSWTILTGLGTPIRITAMDTTVGRKILILANAQIRNIQGNNISTLDNNGNVTAVAARIGAFALFQIMWQTTGSSATSWVSIPESLGMVNNFVWWPDKPWTNADPALATPDRDYGLEQVEVQLMAVLDFSSVSVPGAQVDIGLFGSVTHSIVGQDTEFEMRYGSIIAIPFRA